jgi:hypothetical protein
MLMAHRTPVVVGVADLSGRKDAFCLGGGAFQIKHSSKRLSPWQFTYLPENFAELAELRNTFDPVWVFLVCGIDGVVGLSLDELVSISQVGERGATWIRVTRSRGSMYRVAGTVGELPRAKARGVQAFIEELIRKSPNPRD